MRRFINDGNDSGKTDDNNIHKLFPQDIVANITEQANPYLARRCYGISFAYGYIMSPKRIQNKPHEWGYKMGRKRFMIYGLMESVTCSVLNR